MIGASTSTVSKIGQVLKYGKGGLESVLKKKAKKGGLPHEALAKGCVTK